MKQIAILLLGIIPFASLAQKPIKPSTNNAEKALRAGQFDEAKAIIDATTSSDDFMIDKKGNPSKNAAKAWYLKGLIYAGIDTTKVEKYKSLVPEGFPVAKEAFDKAKALGKGDLTFINDAGGVMPLMVNDANAILAQAYFNKAILAYQDEKDFKKAFAFTEKTMYFIPEDTSVLMNTGVFFAPAAEEYEKAISYIKKYQDKGGKSTDAYIMLFSIYRDKLKDNDKALALAQDLVKKFPGNAEYPKFELDMYIKMNRLAEAKAAMQKQAAADPSDKESRYFLGIISMELNDPTDAQKWYEEAIKLDPKYFEPQIGLAEVIYSKAKAIKAEMNQLGNSKEDFKKKVDLDKKYQDELRVALPYWERCEKLNPDEGKVLDSLYMIYNDLEMTAQVTRIEKRMKALGLLD